jgi:uncharacterized protein (DUF2236 family)
MGTSGPLAWLDRVVGVPPVDPGAPGDPGLFGPGSAVWTIGRERLLLLAGPAALLMQIAHPLVAAGVAAHSGFRRDPFRRLRATLAAVLAISFGDRLQAERAARSVRRVHAGVNGRLADPVGRYPSGTPYDAEDPTLAMWVHATLVHAALEGFGRFVRPATDDERDRYFQESKRFAALFGVTPSIMPEGLREFQAYVGHAIDELWVGESAMGLARQILRPPVPAGLRPAVPAVRLATAALLPARIRHAYGLEWNRTERVAFEALSRSLKATLPAWPARARFWPHYRAAMART